LKDRTQKLHFDGLDNFAITIGVIALCVGNT
jgi:hypothetical protein